VVSTASSGEALVLTEIDGHVGRIVLNRPAKRNALNLAMRRSLEEGLAALEADDEVRVVVLTGSGGSFCAGVDLTDAPPSEGHVLATRPTPVAEPFAAFSKPLIAAIDGPAYGGGLELALACDIRVASPRATFALPEVRLGSLPGSGGTQRLVRMVPSSVAARMLLTGDPVDAAEAHRIGLVSDLADDVSGFAMALATRVAANAPLSLRAVKQCLAAAYETPLSGGLELERALWALLSTTDDRREGRAAFKDRRPPRYTGN
jgi:E-phenylitaconyl-CoA hydratase